MWYKLRIQYLNTWGSREKSGNVRSVSYRGIIKGENVFQGYYIASDRLIRDSSNLSAYKIWFLGQDCTRWHQTCIFKWECASITSKVRISATIRPCEVAVSGLAGHSYRCYSVCTSSELNTFYLKLIALLIASWQPDCCYCEGNLLCGALLISLIVTGNKSEKCRQSWPILIFYLIPYVLTCCTKDVKL